MTSPVILLAQLEALNPLNATLPDSKAGGLMVKNILLIIGIGLGLAGLLAAWARFYVRGRQRQRQRHHRPPEARPAPSRIANDSEPADEPEERGRRRRRRRHRRDHRPRNPTLAETGGLPPGKPEGLPPQNP
jgi:hypothetical protein